MKLYEIAEKLKEEKLLVSVNGADVDVSSITFDSRNVENGTLFTCKGAKFKPEYLESALQNGAVAYLSETTYPFDAPSITVTDIRKAMSIVAMHFYGYPSKSFKTVGITGTKGKTTTSFFLTNIFNAYTKSGNAAITTVEVLTGKEKKKAVLTTPEAYDLQKIFAEVKANETKFLTMEVSSQALKVDRVYGMQYDVGIFLNIDDDHISPNEHPDWEDYFQSKLKLFAMSKLAVVNADDPHADRILPVAKANAEKVITYGKNGNADYNITDVRKNGEYFDFDVESAEIGKQTYTIAMHGKFNCENAVAAIITAKHLGVDDESIRTGLKETLVPGRMDMFYNKERDVRVIVDFAHNKLSFNKLFESIKEEYPERRLVVVIGSAGGKGFQRRKAIGEVLTKYADYAVLTDCDSNYEDTQSICNDILKYVGENGPKCDVILNREEAITATLNASQPGDIVALVARGEESRRWWKGNILQCVPDTELARRFAENIL